MTTPKPQTKTESKAKASKPKAKATSKPQATDTAATKKGSKKTPAKVPEANGQASVEEMLRQMTEAGITLADLMAAAPSDGNHVPTVSEYRPRVEESLTPGSLPTYATYLNDLEAAHGDTPIDKITTTDLKVLMNKVTERAKGKGKKGSHGRSESPRVS